MINARKIAEVMGLPSKQVRSLHDLTEAVEHGLPKKSLVSVVKRATNDPQDQKRIQARVVPLATFKRRRESLSPEESERTERLARVIATAQNVWDDDEEAREFLNTPHPELAGQRPIEAALTELGAREVENVLWQLFYGHSV
jgi:putative toxin-antitoxin system antitoxin component (TIGR02293 family)